MRHTNLEGIVLALKAEYMKSRIPDVENRIVNLAYRELEANADDIPSSLYIRLLHDIDDWGVQKTMKEISKRLLPLNFAMN